MCVSAAPFDYSNRIGLQSESFFFASTNRPVLIFQVTQFPSAADIAPSLTKPTNHNRIESSGCGMGVRAELRGPAIAPRLPQDYCGSEPAGLPEGCTRAADPPRPSPGSYKGPLRRAASSLVRRLVAMEYPESADCSNASAWQPVAEAR